MTPAERERRVRDRELRKRGELALSRGLLPVPDETGMLGAAFVLARKLADASNVRRASETARMAHALMQRSLASHPAPEPLACRLGCNHCCHNMVSVTAPEAFLIARAVRTREHQPLLLASALQPRLAAAIGLSADQRVGRRIPCPLLIDGACSIYAERPIMCRQVAARDATLCRQEADGEDVEVPGVPRYLAHASNAGLALLGALAACRHDLAFFELSAATERALDTEAERRWLAGDDVFAGVQRSPVPAQLTTAAHRLGQALSPLIHSLRTS